MAAPTRPIAAVRASPSSVVSAIYAWATTVFAAAKPASTRLDEVISEFSAVPSPQDRLKLLIEYSKQLKPMPAEAKTDANRVMDELYALGARGILISAIHAIRL